MIPLGTALAVGGMAARAIFDSAAREPVPSPTIQKNGNTPLSYEAPHVSGGLSQSYNPLLVEHVRRFVF